VSGENERERGTCPAHSLLVQQVEQLVGRVDKGFSELRGAMQSNRAETLGAIEHGFDTAAQHLKTRCEGIEESIAVIRQDTSDRISTHRDRFEGQLNRVHERIDEHIEKQHAKSQAVSVAVPVESKPGSEPHLPRAIEITQKWIYFVLALGAGAGLALSILYGLYRAAEAGLFR
jgi:hypothetical protein